MTLSIDAGFCGRCFGMVKRFGNATLCSECGAFGYFNEVKAQAEKKPGPFVYRKIDTGAWIVGFWDSEKKWHNKEDFETEEEANVACLTYNGEYAVQLYHLGMQHILKKVILSFHCGQCGKIWEVPHTQLQSEKFPPCPNCQDSLVDLNNFKIEDLK